MTEHQHITKIPYRGGSGVTPTGAMQFEEDWPGLFIRGDDVGRFATAIRRLQSHLTDSNDRQIQSSIRILSELADIMENDVWIQNEP